MRAVLVILALVLIFIFIQDGEDAEFSIIRMSSSMKISVATTINDAGFNCPAAITAHDYGQDENGTKTKIYCSNSAEFNVTIRPDGSYLVKPWS